MKIISIVNHPRNEKDTEKKIKEAIGEECYITYFDVTNITKKIISKIASSCDMVIFYSSDLSVLKNLIKDDKTVSSKLRTIRCGKDKDSYKLCKLN